MTIRLGRLVFSCLTILLQLSLVLCANPANAVTRDWNTDNGNWSNAANWTPIGVPSSVDTARIGNLAFVENDTVTLDQNDTVAEVRITDGMNLDTDGFTLLVNGDTFVSGSNFDGGTTFHSDLILRRGVGSDDYDTDNLTITDNGRVAMNDGAILEVDVKLTVDSDSSLRGEGVIRLPGAGIAYQNDGLLDPTTGGLTINVTGGGSLDLDGTLGNGRISLTAGKIDGSAYDNLTINGGTLADPFGGEIGMTANAFLAMNLLAPWSTSSGSIILIFGSSTHPGPAVISGADVAIGGELSLTGSDAHGRIDVDATFTSTADVSINVGDRLEMNGSTTVEGGQYMLAENAEIDFDGPTTINGGLYMLSQDAHLDFNNVTTVDGGQYTLSQNAQIDFNNDTTVESGTFTTFNKLSSGGSVDFNCATEWDGTATFNGIARQVGDAGVTGPTTINADVLDMDGGGNTTWNIANSLVINAEGVDSTISNSFDGTLNISGGFFPKLTINLDNPAGQWTMAGEMNLSNLVNVPFSITRVAGSPMRVTGEQNVSNLVGISAPTTFDNSSVTNFASATTNLSMHGETTVRPGATFNGLGMLVNTADEGMTLENGVSLDEVGLINGGLLKIGDSPGVAAVDRFENTEDGTWLVEIGGHIAGLEHDLLLVTDGETLLDGLIEVDLIDAGGGLFLPEIGDEFTVLTSLGDVTGMFTNDPVSFAAGQAFHWEVLHHPNDVTLVLAEITNVVPEPSSMFLSLVLFCGAWSLRRRIN